eukprot:SAG11_NODE_14288_length_618_cov_0.976879_2_plen_104_part_01
MWALLLSGRLHRRKEAEVAEVAGRDLEQGEEVDGAPEQVDEAEAAAVVHEPQFPSGGEHPYWRTGIFFSELRIYINASNAGNKDNRSPWKVLRGFLAKVAITRR